MTAIGHRDRGKWVRIPQGSELSFKDFPSSNDQNKKVFLLKYADHRDHG